MQKVSFDELIEQVVAQDPRYCAEAYGFLREALDHTQKRLKPAETAEPERHVSGRQLLEGIRGYALAHYGPMAIDLFHAWGVRRCEDFGEIVFTLIDHRVLRKTDTDSREDFRGGYDFEDAFRHPFLSPSQLQALRGKAPPRPETV